MREDDEGISGRAFEPPDESAAAGERPFSERRALVEGRKRLFDRKHLGRSIGAALSIAIFALSVFVLARVVANLDIFALRAAIAATSAEQIAAACLLTCVSYLALTGYDALALRQIGAQVPYRVTALGSFTSYAISFTLGFPLITAGAVRYWIYSRAGLSAGKVASLTVVAGVTFWLGMAFVAGVSMVARADAISWIDNLPWQMNAAIGAGVLVAISAYVGWVAVAPRRVRVQGFRLRLPGPLVTLGQMTLGVVDLCAAAGVLYVLLPAKTPIDFPSFAATYVLGCILGIASHAPGGIGVFEATMLKFVPAPSTASLIASLLLFRIIYYLAPFVFALALLGADEGLRRWKALRNAMESEQGDED
ncbi:MAG TPA: lysylphosphatidylglycerol synthase domain-containing protein [Rhodoblastus sp.]|nr:lysylphosphatidylglycerol synthase domain-containing protein [Rhodoblastus sp.]